MPSGIRTASVSKGFLYNRWLHRKPCTPVNRTDTLWPKRTCIWTIIFLYRKATNVADYLANQYGSVAPWRVRGLGVMWLRAIPDPTASVPKTGLRTERLEADIAAGRANFVLEARGAPGPDGAVKRRLVQVRLTERLPADDPAHRISMFRSGRGVVPTGFRNGVRSVLYPVSQLARGLRGG